MGIMDRFNRKKAKGEVDIDKAQLVDDALKVVHILKNSQYNCTMPFQELLIRFCRVAGLPMEIAQERLVQSLNLLKKGQGIGWGGLGSEVCFSRTIPIVVVT